MGIFNRTVNKAAISPEPTKAAAAGGTFYQNNNAGAQLVGQYYSYVEGTARNRAMSVPTISRARDLMASVIGCMNLKMYNEMWNGSEMEKIPLAPRSWLRRIDPAVPNNFLLSWLFDDLFFFGRSFLFVTARTADGFPTSFTRLPAAMVQTLDQAGPVWFAPSKDIVFNGGGLDPNDVVQFLSPIQGIIYMSETAVATALKLEGARYRNSSSAIPAGILRQTGGEPLSAQELADLAAAFNAARETNQTAALNEFVTYTETLTSPDKMLLIDSAEFQGKELARLCNIPMYLAGFDVGSYAYTSSAEARMDLWTFGVRAYADCIAGTLSQNNVLPNGTYVEFDVEQYLKGEYSMTDQEDTQTETNERVVSPT
jgi:organic radical activating enzyme